MHDIWRFARGLVRHWIPLVTGGAIMAGLGVLEHKTGSTLPWPYYGTVFFLFFLYSCFAAWRDEYQRGTELEERAKPKLSIQFRGTHQRPEMQDLGPLRTEGSGFIETRLFRVAVRNEGSVPINGAQLVLESVESDHREDFFPGHGLRVMGSREPSPRFDIAAGGTQWVDLAGYTVESSGEYYFIPYAELGDRSIPTGRHSLTLRADGGGLPSRARVVLGCPGEEGLFDVKQFELLSDDGAKQGDEAEPGS
jgi:hypothetical protein